MLALAAPLAGISPAPRDQPAATAAGKAAGVEVDDEDAGGRGPSHDETAGAGRGDA